MEQKEENYIAYSVEDIKVLLDEADRLNKGNGFRKFLKKEGFKEESPDLFCHEQPKQLIRLARNDKGLSYINLLDENDKGMFIQFLQNRMLSENYIIPNQEIYTLLSAISMALELEKLSNKTVIRPLKSIPGKTRKGKGI